MARRRKRNVTAAQVANLKQFQGQKPEEPPARDEAAREVRIQAVLALVSLPVEIARPKAESLVDIQDGLQVAIRAGDTKGVADLSLAEGRLTEQLGLTHKEHPAESDINSLLWLRTVAKAASALRFDQAHLEEVRGQEALALEVARTGDEGVRERLASLTASLTVAWKVELPGLFRAEMTRVCQERGLDAAPDWLTLPERWT